MTKKFFVMLMAAIFLIQGAAFAKKKSAEIPESERIRIAVEVTDATDFTELDTAEILRDVLISQLEDKKIFQIVGADEKTFANIKTLEGKKGASDIGDILVFSTKNPYFDVEFYRELDAQYVIHCEILGIGLAEEKDENFGIGNGIGIGVGSGGNFGVGVFGGVNGGSLRNYYCTAVNMQLVEVKRNAIISRKNLIGKSLKRKKPKKGYDDASDEAYLKSIEDAAKIISKRVTDYTEKNILKIRG